MSNIIRRFTGPCTDNTNSGWDFACSIIKKKEDEEVQNKIPFSTVKTKENI